MGESGLQASIEWLLRQRLGVRFALLPSLASPLPFSFAFRATDVRPSSGTSCWARGEWSAPAVRPPPPAGSDPGHFPDPSPVGLLLPLPQQPPFRFHVRVNPSPWSSGEPGVLLTSYYSTPPPIPTQPPPLFSHPGPRQAAPFHTRTQC